ncbi:MAG TPA: UdgX family uracil-DNA binding protein [Micromonosporaceae bacterium]
MTPMSAREFIPAGADLDALATAAKSCQGCELSRDATQTVFGTGPEHARVVLVGEQPGDIEDRRGAPFVGPAGRLLDRALEESGIARQGAYVTNAVKHFRFKMVGKRRLHQTPDRDHIEACRPWLTAEFAVLDPELVVVLGATAVKALLGTTYRVTKDRGRLLPFEVPTNLNGGSHAAKALITTHPSAVLRTPDELRPKAYADLVADLKVAADALS